MQIGNMGQNVAHEGCLLQAFLPNWERGTLPRAALFEVKSPLLLRESQDKSHGIGFPLYQKPDSLKFDALYLVLFPRSARICSARCRSSGLSTSTEAQASGRVMAAQRAPAARDRRASAACSERRRRRKSSNVPRPTCRAIRQGSLRSCSTLYQKAIARSAWVEARRKRMATL